MHSYLKKILFLALSAGSLFSFRIQAGVVTSAADDDSPGTLRSVIAASASGDTISFNESLIGQTITLTAGQLVIDKNLIINGPGAAELALNGNHASRVV